MNKKGLIFLVCSVIALIFTAFYYFPNYYNFYILDEFKYVFNGNLEASRGFEAKKDTELVFTSISGLSDMHAGIYTESGDEITAISDLSKDTNLIRISLTPGKYFFKILGNGEGKKKKISYTIAYKRFEMAWQKEYTDE